MNWTRILQARKRSAPVGTRRQAPCLRVELLEDRSVPAVVGGFPFTANVFGGGNFDPFPGFTGQVRVASGDVNHDGVADIITAQGPGAGSGSEIRIFDGAAARGQSRAVLIADFFAYSDAPGAGAVPGFAGGVFVAAADFNGDGFAEVVTSAGAGGQGHVKVFDFRDPTFGTFLGSTPILRASFYAYPGYEGDVRVAALNRAFGQTPLLITASGAGTTDTDLRAYANPFSIGSVAPGQLVAPVAQTFAFPGYLGGVSIASGGTSFGGPSQLFLSTNVGAPTLGAFGLGTNGAGGLTLAPISQFQAGVTPQTDVRLGVADINGDGVSDVLTSFVGPTGAGTLSAFGFNGTTFTPVSAANLTGFQGFGLFGGNWLGASSFLGNSAALLTPLATLSNLSTFGVAGLTTGTTFGTGLGGGLIGGTPGAFGMATVGTGLTPGVNSELTTTTTAGTPTGFTTGPAFFGTSASTNLSRGII